ncbi:MAG: thiamine ABC transporter substrate-binding protein [Anaerolineae bacterium]
MAMVVGLVLAALTGTVHAQDSQVVRVVAHDSFAVNDDVLAAFEAATGYQVEILRVGDAGLMVNQSILSREHPLGDVLFGIDNTFLTRALDNDLFVSYESPLRETISPEFLDNVDGRVTPIDYGDVCLNYDANYFNIHDLALPETLQDLADPAYNGLLVVQNPASSSPGLAFLLATVAAFGEDDYLDYWQSLVANDVAVAESWTDAYYGQFSGSAGSTGTRPLVVSYASSPAAEVYFAEEPPEAAPTGSIVAPGTCFRQVEYAGVLNGAANPEGAQAFIDFMLSEVFQADMPLNMFVYPVVPDIELPDVFIAYAPVAEEPAAMTPEAIGELRDGLIEHWTEVVLR